VLRLVNWDPDDAGENPENETGPKRTSSKITKKDDVKEIEMSDKVEVEQFELKHTKTIKYAALKVHKNENFFGFEFEFCPISLLVMHK
jgi:hypothetical protein